MPEHRLRVSVIIGSIRNGRFGPTAARWIADEAAEREDLAVDVIDLAKVWLPEVLPADEHAERPTAVQGLAPWPARADAFIIVTPEYNHSFPASLKNAVDWYVDEWQAKPVAFVSYKGIAGGLRAVARLRDIFPGPHAVTVRDSVAFPEYWTRFGNQGRPVDATAPEAAARTMLDQLTWWGRTLRDARAARPCPG